MFLFSDLNKKKEEGNLLNFGNYYICQSFIKEY